MSSFPCLVRFVSGSGQVRYRLGERLAEQSKTVTAWTPGTACDPVGTAW